MNSSQVLSWRADSGNPVGAQISFDSAGQLTDLILGGGEHLVNALGPQLLGTERWTTESVRFEADEVEANATAGPIQLRVRHNFDYTWQLRIALTNSGARDIRPGRLVLAAAAAPDALLTVHAAGALGVLTFRSRRTGRCLALRLTRGDLVDDDGVLGTPPLVLPAGGRYQLTFSGEWYADAAAVRQRYPSWFPDCVDLDAVDDDLPIGHEDAAVVRHDPDPGRPAREVRVDVSDAAGVTRVDLAYAAEGPTYAATAEDLARAGRINDAAEALCIHQAMINHDLAQDTALALIGDYLSDPPDVVGALRVALRAQLHTWTGDADLLAIAERELRELVAGPGVPLAWLNLWAARRLAGQAVTGIPEVVARLRGLVRQPDIDPVTRAELSLMVAPRDPNDRSRMSNALQEVDLLSAGGPAQLWPPRRDVDRARAVVVRSLLPPAEGSEQPDLHEPVRRLLARAESRPDGREVLAWLTLRGRP